MNSSYPNLTGIHVHVNRLPGEKSYSEHVLMIQLLSAVLWRQNNGPIHLYTTKEDAKFFEEIGLLTFYDKVDTETLEDPEIDWRHFYPAAKMKVLSTVKEFPVAFVDTDFMFKTRVPDEYKDYDIAFVHREGRFWRNYPPLDFMGIREGYKFPDIPELETTHPINVGFLIVNNADLAKGYTDLALDYMRSNSQLCKEVEWASEGLRIFWKSLFVEQRLLGAYVDHKKWKALQLFPYDYYGDTLTWKPIHEDDRLTQAQLNLLDSVSFFHLWGEKASYSEDVGQRNRILNFYSLIEQFRKIEVPAVQYFFDSIIAYTAEKTMNEEGRDVYMLSEYLKTIYNED